MRYSCFVVGLFILILWGNPLCAHRQEIVESNGLQLWCETFGERQDPALLLIAGGGTQGLMWPYDFCEALAHEGYFVIRYDHRDAGLSSSIDYKKNPYTLMDLTKDALGILDYYHINKAHIVGVSMGGVIAQLMGAYFPERTLSLTLIGTSTTLVTFLNIFATGPNASKLSPPTQAYLEVGQEYFQKLSQCSAQEKIDLFVKAWRVINGENVPFNEAYYRQFGKQFFARARHTHVLNHVSAMKASCTEHHRALPLITSPTLIIHGEADPIFGPDHGQALHQAIQGSKLLVCPQMGHIVNSDDYKDIVEAIAAHTQANKS